jgi:hypothetical protein
MQQVQIRRPSSLDSPGENMTDFVLILREDTKKQDFLFKFGEMFANGGPHLQQFMAVMHKESSARR